MYRQLRPRSFETCWFATRSFEITFIWWDRIHLRLVELRLLLLRPHSCETRFLLWLFRPTLKGIFSFLVFHFSVKNWNYCGAPIKETGRNVKHIILWLDLTNWRFRGVMLPSKPEVWRVFLPLRCFKVRVHLQPSVSHFGHGPCKTSNEESPCKTSGLPQRRRR